MRYTAGVQGSQTSVLDFEVNSNSVYARANIEKIETEDGGTMWRYDEVQMTRTEYQRMLALDSGFVREWTAPARVAERRARYERMDPVVSSLRRKIDLGIDAEKSKTKLVQVQEYLHQVHETTGQAGYPLTVEYPDEPSV